MKPEPTAEEFIWEEQLTKIVATGVQIFLHSLEVRLANPQGDDPTEALGKIHILVDEDGSISALLAEQKQDPKSGGFVINVGSREAAYGMELALANWGASPKAVASIIERLDPRYSDPTWAEDLDIAAAEVAEVFLRAMVIERYSPMHTFLRRATKIPHPPKRSSTWILDPNPHQGAKG